MIAKRFIEIAQTIVNFLPPLNRLQMSLINKSGAKAKGKFVIVCRDGLNGKDLPGANIPDRHHLIANLRPYGGRFGGLHIASRQSRGDAAREQEQQKKQNAHNHLR